MPESISSVYATQATLAASCYDQNWHNRPATPVHILKVFKWSKFFEGIQMINFVQPLCRAQVINFSYFICPSHRLRLQKKREREII
jgi:hypothetical protein